MNVDNFFPELLKKNKRIIARAISYVESEYPQAEDILKRVHGSSGNAYRIGITGPPGAGKSTITNQLAKLYLQNGKSVAIIAVDPTSPFTGGALLGDRVRMSDIGRFENIFIRSMATRGSLGGLCKKAIDTADILDAAGYDYIILETVGVGQSELDIVKAADTTMVVLVPESGDSVQAMKAGLMEIADFFVVNKCDRPAAEQAVNALRTILMLRNHDEKTFLPEIVKAVAQDNLGIKEIALEIERHQTHLNKFDLLTKKRIQRTKDRIKEIVEEKFTQELWKQENVFSFEQLIEKSFEQKISPYTIAEEILNTFKLNLSQKDEHGNTKSISSSV
ncbi:MAG: methylmalonyl Co-A mutase-associated GTPase MeaB [Ignavibacteria bacterium CG22_combo_CG10-13_8_21_14_all_37_15]|nr:MAG: methylmalonyl Co-A mutase-associated GTPase MeaB [Ignavibacteria bacterium CG22_combo_CG10-13_8_21_14_all_37_15]